MAKSPPKSIGAAQSATVNAPITTDDKKPEESLHEIAPVFGDYVTRNGAFAKELYRVRDVALDYATRPRVGRPLNILLAAEPGNGKSFLVKQLARAVSPRAEVVFEEFYVAAFRTADDLLGVFQRVQSANLHGKLPFILFDEVDAKVDGRHVLAHLLAPMWDGMFHAGRESFALGRAVFCFAGSNMLPAPTIEGGFGEEKLPEKVEYQDLVGRWSVQVEQVVRKPGEIEKFRDFMDRVDMMVCIPPVHACLLGDDIAQEQIDLACIMVRKHFPQVTRVEKSAIGVLILKLTQSSSRRRAEKTVFSSTTPKDGTFRFTHLPAADQELHKGAESIGKLHNTFLRFVVTGSSMGNAPYMRADCP